MRPEHWLYTIPLRLRSLFHWTQADRELDDELRDHLARKTEEYMAQGMTQEEAHRRARLARPEHSVRSHSRLPRPRHRGHGRARGRVRPGGPGLARIFPSLPRATGDWPRIQR